MPMDRSKYPPDWDQIAKAIKTESEWQCECCGKQCRLPGEPLDTHTRTLTVAHLNHIPMDCRPGNLMAMCAPCHLRYDSAHHSASSAKTRRERRDKNQMVLFVIEGLT